MSGVIEIPRQLQIQPELRLDSQQSLQARHVALAMYSADEADPILIVDPNTVLAPTIAPETLELVAGWHRQRLERDGGIQLVELPPSHAPERIGAPPPRSPGVDAIEG